MLPNLLPPHRLPTAERHPPAPASPARWVASWAGTFLGVTVPLAGLAVAVVLLWSRGFWWVDLALLVGMYLLTLLGITVGFHRLFTHRSFQTVRPIQFLLGVFGSMAFQGALFGWVGRHRLHHQYSDQDGDPHSPHVPTRGPGARFRRFWHAHVGWGFAPSPPDLARYAGDLARSRLLRVVDALFPVWAVLGLLLPAGIGYAFGGWGGALTGFLWGGLVRVLLVHHVTWSVNSVCHLWGSRPYPERDESRNNLVVGVLALGEGWHNNHHAFPTSARHGFKWWQLDISYGVIRALAAVGLAWKIRLPKATETQAGQQGDPAKVGDPAAVSGTAT